MTQLADEKTRRYLLRLMEESPDELTWLVKTLMQQAMETQYDIGRLAGLATRVNAIKDMWRQSANDARLRESLHRLMKDSPDDIVIIVKSLMHHLAESQCYIGKLADLATRFQAIKELWQVLEMDIEPGEQESPGSFSADVSHSNE